MEHEVFVPVPAEVLRATLTDPDRVVRCVPGLQRDADAEAGPLTGRLKVRVGGNTITYRGALRIVERDGAITYEGQGTEVRGKGSAELSLTVVLTPAAEGTGLSFTGALTATGRLADAAAETRSTAGARLLDRFVEAVTDLATETARAGTAGTAEEPGARPVAGDAGGPGTGAADAGRPSAGGVPREGTARGDGEPTGADGRADRESPGRDDAEHDTTGRDTTGRKGAGRDVAGRKGAEADGTDREGAGRDATGRNGVDRDGTNGTDDRDGRDGEGFGRDGGEADVVDDGAEESGQDSVFDVSVPPSSLDPLLGEEFGEDLGGVPLEFPAPQPAAEAAHARRTMIGRSAEEVDHAPPRGRYAPVPAPEANSAGATLRWIAPAAVLALASAVVVGRALRRRR
ncbi:SRPBCC family protein [Streptomyces sp. NPDC101490]|uniref:SRPBCC family protein n=1 Tax=Streptomyces sp. NPDC101490 TaxID=3366143 RepID=UPI0037F90CFD